MSSLHRQAFGAGHRQVKNYLGATYMNTLGSKQSSETNLNLSRRFPLDTDCNTQTKKILLENQGAVPVHHLALD